jgi:hypothetical protein
MKWMEEAIVGHWSDIMDLKEYQKERANQAAQVYVRELCQWREQYGIYARKDRANNVESVIGDLEYLIKSLQAQIKAFELLDGILEESQRLRLEKATVRVYTPSTGESPDSALRIAGSGMHGGLELLESLPVADTKPGDPFDDE